MNAKTVVLILMLVLSFITQFPTEHVYYHDNGLYNRSRLYNIRSIEMEAFLDNGFKNSWAKDRSWEAKVIDIAIVYSNMSSIIYFIAIKNNTWLYAKYAVIIEPRHNWVLVSYNNEVVNVTKIHVIKDHDVKEIKLQYRNKVFIVRVKWVSSFKEIPEIEEETRYFVKLTFDEFIKNILLGVFTMTIAIIIIYHVYSRRKVAIIEGVGS